MKARDLTGLIFGRYTVLSRRGLRGNHLLWNCRCSCGEERQVSASNLTTGNSRSCGCLNREHLTKHGQSGGNRKKSLAYVSWNMMKDRCSNPNNPEFHNYGGRGIAVCPEWADFRAFYRDMGDRPPGLSIHRINNDAGYSKANCVWADDVTQAENRRSDGPYLRAA